MAMSHAGNAASHAESPAKIRPIPAPGRTASGRAGAAGVTADRPAAVGLPTPAPVAPDAPVPEGNPALVAEACATALQSLDVLERHARDVADGFRWGHLVEAHQGLVALVESTQTLLRLAAMAAAVGGFDLLVLCRLADRSADEETRTAVDGIVTAQLRRDWPALAAGIDGPYVSALGQWRAVFERLMAQVGDGLPGGHAA